ncbi:MAG: YceI family protein [Alphaproteobacteria bacterium]
MPSLMKPALACALLLASAAGAGAADVWTVDPADRSLAWTVSFSEKPLEGRFGAFEAEIAFDPADLAGSRVTVTVQIASIEADTPEKTEELVKPEWFDAAAFPTATFAAETFRALGGDAYEADGTLTIRDRSRPVTLPFTFAIDGDSARIAGGLSVNRIDYDVGQGDWAIDDIVGFDVAIAFTLAATRGN